MSVIGTGDLRIKTELTALQEQKPALAAAAKEALRQTILDNTSRMASMRMVQPAAQALTDAFVDCLVGSATDAPLNNVLADLVEKGLGPAAAIQVGKVLAETSLDLLRTKENVRPLLSVRVSALEHNLIHRYNVLREQSIIRNREETYRTVYIALEKQIESERQLRTSAQQLTEQLRENEARLARQAHELEGVAQISAAASTIQDVPHLLQTTVDLTKSYFNLYHAHIYLLNEPGDTLTLTTGAGTIGEQMVTEGRTISLEQEQSLVARAARSAQAVIINDVRQDPGFLPHPLLPETRAEMAVPMMASGRVLGVLDVQSEITEYFAPQEANIMTTLASQIGIAIENARRYTGLQQQAQQLEEATTFLDSIVENTPLMLFVKEAESLCFVRWNKAGEEIVGFPREAMLGKNDFDFFAAEEAEFFTQKDREVLNSGQVLDIPEETIQTAHQGTRLLHTRKMPIIDAQGKPRYLLGISEDITERKQSEDALRASEERLRHSEVLLRSVIDSTPDWIFIKNRDHRYQLVNKSYAETLSLNPDDLIGKNDLELGFPEEIVLGDPEKGIVGFWADDREVMGSGKPKTIAEEPAVVDNQTIYLSTFKTPTYDEKGQVNGVLGFVRDITELKRADEVIKASRSQLAEALRISKLANWEYDVPSDAFTFNDQFYALLRTNAEREGGYNMTSAEYTVRFVHPEDAPLVGTEIGKALMTTDPDYAGQIEHRIIYADGEEGFVSVGFRIQKDEAGQTVKTFGANQDITERKRAEAQSAKQARELEAVAQISAAASTIQETTQLLQTVVDLTKGSFGLYHSHIYLLQENNETLVLTSGAGQIGRQMVKEGRTIPLSREQSLVARAARLRQAVIVNDVQAEEGFLPHPLLPDTRAEMAVPLLVGGRVLGVLDVQGDKPGQFTAQDANIMTTLASQVGIALQNARSFEQYEETLKELNLMTRRLIREGWDDYLESTPGEIEFAYGSQPTPVEAGHNGYQALSKPLAIQGEVIGRLALVEADEFDEDADEIVTAIAERLSSHLESIRLTEQTQQALAQTEALYTGSGRVSRASTVQEAMDALVESTALQKLDRANIVLYDRPWLDKMPNTGTVIAVWERSGTPPRAPVGTVYQANQFPSIQHFSADHPTIFNDMALDDRVDDNLRTLFINRLGMQSLFVFPFIMSGQWWGFISGQSARPMYLTEDEIRRISSLSEQTATVIQTLRLFEQATVRAEQLSILNEMARDLTIALDVDSALETIHHYTDLLMDARSFYIALYDEETSEIRFPIALEDGRRVRWASRKVGNGLTEHVIKSGEGLLIEQGVDAWLEAHGIASIGNPAQSWMGMPLKLANIVLGVVACQSQQPLLYGQEEYDLLTAVANQGSIAIQNSRLFEQTQRALAETETLFAVSRDFNAANNPEEIINAIASPAKADNASGIDLYFIETDADGKPEWVELRAVLQYEGEIPIPVGSRFYLPQLPISHFWLSQIDDPVFMDDVREETRLDESSRTILEMTGVRSAVYLPLTVGGRWVALIGLRWTQPHTFTPGAKRLAQSLAAQAAVAVNNYQLFEQAQKRARQLELLTHIETELSQAASEQEIVQAFVSQVELGNPFVFLAYFREDDKGDVAGLDPVTVWNQGAFLAEIPTNWHSLSLMDLPLLRLWEANPAQLLLLPDVESDPRSDDALREQAQQEGGWHAAALLPLRSGGRWQAIIGMTWQDPHPFSSEELFYFERLQEPIAAAIAGRRAFLAQQNALAETEALYRATADINASRRYYEIISVLRNYTLGKQPVKNVTLNLFDRPWSKGQMQPWVEVVERLQEAQELPIGSRFNLSEFPSVVLILNQEEPIFISDLHGDNRVDTHTREIYHDRLGAHSIIFIPLVAGGQWLGFVDAYYEEEVTFAEVELRRMLALTGQAAVATQNLRSVDLAQQRAQEAQARREESELLYNLSAQLTAANTLEDVLRIVISPASESGARSGVLALFSPDGVDDPVLVDVVAGWSSQKKYLIAPDTQWPVKDHPHLQFLLRYPRSPLYVHDTNDEIQVPSAAARSFFAEHGTESLICLPLNIGRRRLGIILLEWDTARTFSNAEQRLYHSIAGQASVVVDNRQLLIATQTRAAQLDKLSRIETALSIADTDEEILLAVLSSCNTPYRVSLLYIETDRYDNPLYIIAKQLWQEGEFVPHSPAINRRLPLPPAAQLWIENPTEVFIVEDAEQDGRLDAQTRAMFEGYQTRAFAVLPLRSSGRWQGLINFSWIEPYTASTDERFIWRRLLDALGAVLASRRALVAQQAAREETERLYNASRRLNEVAELSDMLHALVSVTPTSVINRAVLMMFEYDEAGELVALNVRANWFSGVGVEPAPVGTRFSRETFKAIPIVQSQEPIFINDIREDPRFDAAAQNIMQQFNIKAVAMLPLWIGSQQRGSVLLQSEETHEFLPREIEPYTALAGQLAIAIENQRLFEQTRQQLSDLTAIQQTTSLLTATLTQNEAIKALLPQIAKAVGVEVVNLYILLDDEHMVRAGQYAAIPVPEFPENEVLELDDYPMTRDVIATRQPAIRLADDPRLSEQSRQNLSGRTANATIPLLGQDKVWGVISINSYQPDYIFTPHAIRLVQTLAEQATIALERVRLLEETTRRARREQILREITAKVRGASDVETVMRTTVHEVGRILGRRTFVHLQKPEPTD